MTMIVFTAIDLTVFANGVVFFWFFVTVFTTLFATWGNVTPITMLILSSI